MEKYVSLFLAILMIGFVQQILAQDENATADENATSDENAREERWRVLRESSPGHASADDSERWSDFLPLMKDAAGDADLPLPFGIGVTGYWQEQDLKEKGISFDLDATVLGILTPISTKATATNIESEVDNFNLRVDAWVFPFLNVYGIYGEVEGENTASGLGLPDLNATVLGNLALAGVDIQKPFPLSYDGNVYGFGLILAGQWGKYWGTIDYNFTQADLSISTAEIDTHTFSPRIGRSGSLGNVKGSLWIGAMHQRVDERQLGNLVFSSLAGDIPVSYDASFEQENEWNFLLGGSAGLSKQWNASIEGGFGDRKQVMGNLTFRF